jgi:peptidoglycan/xylan/chitin deacetylase (PgdA/CDA1 family)
MMARAGAVMRALAERPTLFALALTAGVALLSSLAAAAGLPSAPGARLAVVLAAWSALAGLIAFAFLPGFDLPGRAMRSVSGKRVALTFDDGPHPDTTPALLAALRELGVRATFFLVGEAVDRWPELARRIGEEGHTIGNHTQHHRLLVFRTAEQILAEVAGCQRALASAGLEARLFRPPHGFKPVGLHHALRRHRLKLVAWQGSIRDTDAPGSEVIVERAVALAQPGRILLLHDHPRCHAQLLQALPEIVERYRVLGLDWVALE